MRFRRSREDLWDTDHERGNCNDLDGDDGKKNIGRDAWTDQHRQAPLIRAFSDNIALKLIVLKSRIVALIVIQVGCAAIELLFGRQAKKRAYAGEAGYL